MADRIPGAGPWPTPDEVRAAQERMACPAGSLDQHAAALMAARIAQLAPLLYPVGAAGLAERLAVVVEDLAVTHTSCRTVGCPLCLRLADAGAIVAVWRSGCTR